ncbi:DUF2125 domain-containing protein [Tabrizicola sp.]|uniref:DUF2125 domain-containing protein n=1 Tax=Tabrizicola sp. TaxID=2005166 RepID=UPI003F40F0D0
MRKLLYLLLIVSVLWSGYWFVGAYAIRSGADSWFAQQAQSGMVAEKSTLTVAGFPNRFDLTVQDLRLADPRSGISWQAPFAQVFAMTWKPWHIIAALPPSQVVALPDQAVTVDSQDLKASVRARPSTDLPLQEVRLAGTSLGLTSDLGWTLGLGEFTVGLRAEPTVSPSTYELGFDLAPIIPDPAFLAALKAVDIPDLPPPNALQFPAPDFPDQVESLQGSIYLTLSAPLDRHAGDARPYLTKVEIRQFNFAWGQLAATASGLIEADGNGYASGKITVEVTNWDRLPALLVAAGVVQLEVAPTVANGMRALAAQTPDPTVLSLTLDMTDGQMSFGPFPLGPAPLMVPPSG